MIDIKQKLKSELKNFVVYIRNHYSENLCTENSIEEEEKCLKDIGQADLEKRRQLVEIEFEKITKNIDEKYAAIKKQLNSNNITTSHELFKLKNRFFNECDKIIPMVKIFVKKKFDWYIQHSSYYFNNKKDFDEFYDEYTNSQKTLENFDDIVEEIIRKL